MPTTTATAPAAGPTRPATSLKINSRFGWRTNPVTGLAEFHPGIDIKLAQGSPVHPLAFGVVGKVVPVDATRIASVELFHASLGAPWQRSRYLHLSRIDVKPGDVVSPSTVIGLSGGAPGVPGSGTLTTGAHLHLETSTNTGSGYNLTDPLLSIGDWKP